MILKLIRIWFRQFSIINLNYLLFYLIKKKLKKQWCCTDFILENVCRRPVNSIIIENSYGNSGQKQVGVYCNNFSIHDQTFKFFRKREISFLSLTSYQEGVSATSEMKLTSWNTQNYRWQNGKVWFLIHLHL